ncbi:hypothetical protein GEOBRER4_n0481 [Citrifermentans bremense]|uniref:Uncharacterized protein n=1 Tax=Citrifermentans bremense TaxID=60035 RepID=A0A7R7FRV6_9BACT|nr:hypothetical protein GEOBRER4_n0481 [Citrifermentans bremense]
MTLRFQQEYFEIKQAVPPWGTAVFLAIGPFAVHDPALRGRSCSIFAGFRRLFLLIRCLLFPASAAAGVPEKRRVLKLVWYGFYGRRIAHIAAFIAGQKCHLSE